MILYFNFEHFEDIKDNGFFISTHPENKKKISRIFIEFNINGGHKETLETSNKCLLRIVDHNFGYAFLIL